MKPRAFSGFIQSLSKLNQRTYQGYLSVRPYRKISKHVSCIPAGFSAGIKLKLTHLSPGRPEKLFPVRQRPGPRKKPHVRVCHHFSDAGGARRVENFFKDKLPFCISPARGGTASFCFGRIFWYGDAREGSVLAALFRVACGSLYSGFSFQWGQICLLQLIKTL